MMKDLIINGSRQLDIPLDDVQVDKLMEYARLLVEWNEKMNLTAITDEHGVAVKHFADSLTLYNFVDVKKNASIIDVGTGAGFPGVVLKIARPDIKLRFLTALTKDLHFSTQFLTIQDLMQSLFTAGQRRAVKISFIVKSLILPFQEQLQG